MTPLMDRVPMNRMGEPLDVANTALFLASEEGRYYTGSILHPMAESSCSEIASQRFPRSGPLLLLLSGARISASAQQSPDGRPSKKKNTRQLSVIQNDRIIVRRFADDARLHRPPPQRRGPRPRLRPP